MIALRWLPPIKRIALPVLKPLGVLFWPFQLLERWRRNHAVDQLAAVIWRVRRPFDPIRRALKFLSMPIHLRAVVYVLFWSWLISTAFFWFGVSSAAYERANAWRRIAAWLHEAASALIAFGHNPFDPVWAGITMAARAALALLGWAVTHPAEALGAATVIAAIGFLLAVLRELRRDVVIVEPFEVPECAERLGYTGAVLARRLVFEAEERTRGAGWGIDGPSMNLGGETPDLELPGSRLSVQSAARFLREALIGVTLMRVLIGIKHDRVVRGHVLRDGGGEVRTLPSGRRGTASPPLYRLRLRLPSEHAAAPLSDAHPLINLTKAAAPDLLALVVPSVEMALAAETGKDDRADALAADLRARARRAPKWRRPAADYQMAHCSLVRAFFAKETVDRKEALENAAHNLRRHGWSAEAQANRGAALGALGRFKDAVKAHNRALAIEPNHAHVHNNRGSALSKLANHHNALKAFECALEIDPSKVGAHYNRGAALANMGRHEEALAAYDQALAIDPNHADAHNNRGVALGVIADRTEELAARITRRREAVAAYREAWCRNPNNVWIRFNISNAERQLAKDEAALAAKDEPPPSDDGA